jgi:hypothetical protein
LNLHSIQTSYLIASLTPALDVTHLTSYSYYAREDMHRPRRILRILFMQNPLMAASLGIVVAVA